VSVKRSSPLPYALRTPPQPPHWRTKSSITCTCFGLAHRPHTHSRAQTPSRDITITHSP
jgi:hypothetical protein